MKNHRSLFHLITFLASLISALIALEVAAFAQEQRPNLQALPAWNITLSNGLLSFNTTSWNSGSGPLELIAGKGNNKSRKQKVYQRVYNSDGSYQDYLAGDFVWHKQHNHFHFEQYALYTLLPVTAPTTSQRSSQKTTFCVMDTTAVDTSLSGAPSSAYYSTCGNSKQGMSVGWGDTYGSFLSGQSISVSGLPDGVYKLMIQIDPQHHLLEENENDNSSCVVLNLSISTSTILDIDDNGC